MMGTYVQYGTGWSAGEGWLNFDASPTLRIERLPVAGGFIAKLSGNPNPFPASVKYGDIIRGLPVADETADGIYASHVLEHLALEDVRTALANSFRLLRPGGVFRLIVPDLKARARAYVESENDAGAAGRFLRDTMLGHERRGRTLKHRLRAVFGNSHHLWMFDYPAMVEELKTAGFTNIRRASFGDAEDRMFDRVEAPDRFITDGVAEVAIEARRPLSS